MLGLVPAALLVGCPAGDAPANDPRDGTGVGDAADAGGAVDGGSPDAGVVVDGGIDDAGPEDGGVVDGGGVDGGGVDGGGVDGGGVDGGEVDGGALVVVLDGDAEVDRAPLGPAALVVPLGDDLVVRGLPGGGVDVDDALGAVVAHADDGALRAAERLAGDEAASLGEGGGLVATDVALHAVTRGAAGTVLLPSPLGDALGDVVALEEIGDTLWIATSSGLFRYDPRRFEEVRPGGVPLPATHLAGPVVVDGTPMVVAASPEGTFAVGGDAVLRAFDLGVDATSLAVDVRGVLWVAAGRQVLERSPGAVWTSWLFADDVVEVGAGRGADDVWIVVGDALVHERDHVFRAAGPAPATLRVADDGAALIVDDSGLALRLREGRSVRVVVPREAEVLTAVVDVVAAALPAALGATVTLALDGAPLPSSSLDPTAMSPGLHRLTSTATYPDGDVRVAERQFFALAAALPTWTDDIRPIAEGVCMACHTSVGGAHPLDESVLWRQEIALIEAELSAGRMPIGSTLPDDDLRRVRLWAATGMLE